MQPRPWAGPRRPIVVRPMACPASPRAPSRCPSRTARAASGRPRPGSPPAGPRRSTRRRAADGVSLTQATSTAFGATSTRAATPSPAGWVGTPAALSAAARSASSGSVSRAKSSGSGSCHTLPVSAAGEAFVPRLSQCWARFSNVTHCALPGGGAPGGRLVERHRPRLAQDAQGLERRRRAAVRVALDGAGDQDLRARPRGLEEGARRVLVQHLGRGHDRELHPLQLVRGQPDVGQRLRDDPVALGQQPDEPLRVVDPARASREEPRVRDHEGDRLGGEVVEEGRRRLEERGEARERRPARASPSRPAG